MSTHTQFAEKQAPELHAHTAPDPDLWVDQFGAPLLQYACGRVDDLATAEDLVQETLLVALRNLKKYRGDASFQTWLVSILKRKIADDYRRRAKEAKHGNQTPEETDGSQEFTRQGKWQRAPQPLEGADSKSPEQVAEEAEFWGVLSQCVAQLPTHLARAFRLKTLADNEHEAVCHHEGITGKNLSVRLHRARLMLRRCLEKRWTGDSP